jgi:hypothetical protein
MVPGMTERERLAADVRLYSWLADATLGPTLTGVSPRAAVTTSPRRAPLSLRLVRAGLARARVIGRRMRPIPKVFGRQQPRRNAVSVH